MREFDRQLTHAGFGASIILAGLAFGLQGARIFLLLCLIAALALIQFKAEKKKNKLLDFVLKKFERPGFVAKGALNYVAGALFLYSFAPSLDFALGITAILAFGDGISTVIGLNHGVHKLQFNKKKSWEGLAAFFAAGAISSQFFMGWTNALFYSALLAVIEGLDTWLDDNIAIPFSAILINLVIGK